MIKRIYKYGNPILRKKIRPVKEVTEEERVIFKQMFEIMYKNGGVGLAGPQVGIDKQMIIVDTGDYPVMLANPKILRKQGKDIMEEGCLSLPDIMVKVKRAKEILVEGLTKDNKKIKFHTDNLLARAIQHETDHLKGRLIIDYASIPERIRMKRKLKEIRKKEKNEEVFK